ncbi:hypothetical protein DFH29DRAFT_1066505 [Suillus ampliporus]|nr:hypothetical protein DFH29DRAFT_1066505 [Suillus ampliporus]
MFLPDGRLSLAPNVTLTLLTSSSQPSNKSKVTDVSRRQAPTTSVLPPRLRRSAEGQLHSAKVIPYKHRAESDKPGTVSLRIRIPSSKERTPFMRRSDDSDNNDDDYNLMDSDDTYSECSDEPEDESMDVDIKELLHDQSNWKMSSPDSRAAAHLVTPPETSRASTPL